MTSSVFTFFCEATPRADPYLEITAWNRPKSLGTGQNPPLFTATCSAVCRRLLRALTSQPASSSILMMVPSSLNVPW